LESAGVKHTLVGFRKKEEQSSVGRGGCKSSLVRNRPDKKEEGANIWGVSLGGGARRRELETERGGHVGSEYWAKHRRCFVGKGRWKG